MISPQHLQQQVLYHEKLLDSRLGALSPYNWGVTVVEMDPGSLAAGQVELQKFAGILPGGLPLVFEKGKRAGPPARPIEESFKPTQKSLQVFIGVPREREGVPNVAKADEKDSRARFGTSPREVSDLTSGRAQQVSVAFARTNVRFLFDDEADEDYDSIKVAEIVRNKNGEFEISERFVPSCLQIGASPFLMAGLRRLLGLISAKQRALAETTRASTAAQLEFRGADVTAYLQLNAVSSMLPLVQHLCDAPHFSPWQAYVLLTQTAGQLVAFSATADPTSLPKFAFGDLGATYSRLFDYITELLSGTVIKKYVKIDVKLFRNGVMVGALEDESVRKSDIFVLTARPAKPEVIPDKMMVELPKLSKVGTKANIKTLIQTASNGVPLEVTHRPPPEIPLRDGVIYFQLKTGDDSWKAILEEQNVAMFIPKPYNPGNVKFELLAVPST